MEDKKMVGVVIEQLKCLADGINVETSPNLELLVDELIKCELVSPFEKTTLSYWLEAKKKLYGNVERLEQGIG